MDNDNNEEKRNVQKFINVKEHKFKIKVTAVVAFIAAVFLMAGFGLGMKSAGYFAKSSAVAAGVSYQKENYENGKLLVNTDNSVTGIVDRVGPAVVTIETVSQVQTTLLPREEFYRRFFGTPIPQQEQTEQGLGSGFIISKDGYILTNNHVVEGAVSIKVRLLGFEKPIKAQIVGADKELDLAVLKIKSDKELPVVSLGDSDKISPGDWAIAIGNPYGLDHTVTIGVISAKGRPLTIENHQYKNLLQTDASINPGNSGGPLLNINGEVIGINTAVSTEGQGIGFAIPINTVKEVLQDLIKKGKVSHPWIGISTQDITPDMAGYLETDLNEGAIVTYVVSDSPAEKAGLKQGDIILKIDKQKITDSNELLDKIRNMKIGSKIGITILRDGSLRNLTISISEKVQQ